MTKKLKGIIVKIGGDTSGLSKALKDIDSQLYNTKSDLRDVQKLLKLDPTNTVLLSQKQELLSKSIKTTSERLKELKEAEKAAKAEFEKKNISESEYQSLQREIVRTEQSLKSLEKQAKTVNISLEKVGSTTSSVGKALTIGITTPVIAAGAAIYKYSSDLTEAENKTKEVFKNMSSDVLDWSQTSLDKMGMARSTALDAASLYGGMATAMGLTRKSATDMSKSLTELSVDLASFHNTSLDQASTALKSIFTGETETLKNYGIVMTEANLKAYALSQGIKTNYSEMTQAEKVQLRYNFVMNASKDAIGDYERNCGEAASQMKKLPEASKELATSFKENVEPTITPMIQRLNEAVVWFGKLDDGTKNIITRAALITAAAGPVLTVGGKIIQAVSKTQKVIETLKAAHLSKKSATAADTQAQTAYASSLDTTAAAANRATANLNKMALAQRNANGSTLSTTAYGADASLNSGTFKTAQKNSASSKLKLMAGNSSLYLALAAATIGIGGTIVQKRIKKEYELIDKKYKNMIDESNKAYDSEIQNLTDEYNSYEDKMNKKKSKEEKFYSDKIANLKNDLKAQKNAISEEQKLYEKAHKERLSQLEKEKQAKLDSISASQEAQTAELQQQIDALNALNEADEAATKEQENAEKLAELKKSITFAKTYAEKVDAENAYTAEVKRQEQEKTKAARENQIKQLQNKMEQIKNEASARQEQVKSEYDSAVELENSKYEIAKEGFENRLSALDTYVEDETARLEALRDNAVSLMQSETDTYLAELQKRIDAQEKLKKAAEEAIKTQQKEDEKTKEEKYVAKIKARGVSWYDKDIPKSWSSKAGHNASGTNDWRGGLTYVHERGGELINLPQHAQIIPHDLSVEYMRELARAKTGSQNTYNQYGAQQQVTVLKVGEKTVAEVIEPCVSVKMSDSIYRRRRSGG
nr:MAG TPA: minor tail protein [Caudoviricetes sp.]